MMTPSKWQDGKIELSELTDEEYELAFPGAQPPRAQIKEWKDIHAYMYGGNATFTLLSSRTQSRFTYKCMAQVNDSKQRTGGFYIRLLSGPDNTADYTYLGMIKNDMFRFTAASSAGKDAPSVVALRWFLARKRYGGEPSATLEFWHEGRCGVCGRKLTVPESVARGIGPVCDGRVAA